MKRIFKYLSVLTLCIGITGCMSMAKLVPGLYSGETTKNTRKLDKSQDKFSSQFAELEDLKGTLNQKLAEFESNKVSQGSVFVHGTGAALDKVTNQEPAVVLAKDLNDMAAHALPKPPTEDALAIEKAVEQALSTNRVELAKGQATIKELREKLIDTEEKMADMQVKYEKKIDGAKEDLEEAIERMNRLGDQMAQKANEYDEANSMIGSAKLFLKNFGKFITAFIIVALLGFVAWTAAKLYFPVLQLGENVVKNVGGKVLKKGWVELVKGGEMFKEEVKEHGPVLLEDFKKGLYTSEEIIKEILTRFRSNQERAQSAEVQDIVKTLTK